MKVRLSVVAGAVLYFTSLGHATELVSCGEIWSDWNQIRRDLGVKFSLSRDCDGIEGHFAEAAHLLKRDFPGAYRTAKTAIESTQLAAADGTTTARANPHRREMQIMPRFKRETIESAIMVIVHESAHLVPGTPKHVDCDGVAPFNYRCDPYMTGDIRDGAYNHELGFLFEITALALEEGSSYSAARIGDRLRELVDEHFNAVHPKFPNLKAKAHKAVRLLKDHERRT